MTEHAISHLSAREPDWFAINLQHPETAATSLKSILIALEGAEDRVFSIRMRALRIYSERELWKLDIDPEYDVPFKSMHRWIQATFPRTRYALEANSTQQALAAVPLEDLAGMKRCNAVLLADKGVSDACRHDRDVIEATKTATENEFREKLNRDHDQHLDRPETLKLTYPAGDMASVKMYLARKAVLMGLDPEDYAGALLGVAIDDNVEVLDEVLA
jgi:hypothetical protein